MQKIIHFTTVHPPFDTRIFHKECKTLARAGYDVTLIAQHTQNEIVDDIKILSLPKPINRLQRFFFLAWQAFLMSKKENAAIYHFHDPELLLIGLLLKLFTKGKVIYDVHEDVAAQILDKYWLPAYSKKILSTFFLIFEKMVTRFIDAVITSEDEVAKKMKGVNPTIIHNYPDLCMVKTIPHIKTDKKGNDILYIGGVSKIRGAFEMINVLDLLKPSYNVHLHLIGPLSPEKLIEELQSLPSFNHVTVYGRLTIKDAIQKAHGVKIGLALLHPIPNYVDALPTKLFEYMMLGIPAIVSDVPLWKDIVEINHCGIAVNPFNLREIAAAIEYILSHPEEARIMGDNGRRAVIEKYNWEKEGEKLLVLYQRLLNP